jgi:LysM repeat protein
MRRIVSRSGGLALGFLLVSLVVSGCFQTAGAALDATATSAVQAPPPATETSPAPPTEIPTQVAPPTEELPTQSAPPTEILAETPTLLPPEVLPPTEIPTEVPQATMTETPAIVAQAETPTQAAVFEGGPEATQTSVQATLFAQATEILAGVTQTAAFDLTATATALGTGLPAEGGTGGAETTVPATLAPGTNLAQTTATPQGTPGAPGSGAAGAITGDCVYTVAEGDRLFRIAIRFNTTPEAIARANGIVNMDLILPAQQLRIPNCNGTPTPSVGTGGAATPIPGAGGGSGQVYIVREGDTLFGIATRYRVRVMALAQTNGISNINLIFIGQRLVIP